MTEQDLHQYIEMTPIRGREPVFSGTNITIKHVVDDLANGMSVEEILSEHKSLTRNHIQACFIYMKTTLEEIEELRLYVGTGIPLFWRFLFSWWNK